MTSKVQTTKIFVDAPGLSWVSTTPLLVIDHRTGLDHVWSDPKLYGGTLKGRRRLFRLDVEEKIERRTPEAFRDISDGVRRAAKWFSEPE